MWTRPVSLINAHVVTNEGTADSIRFARTILSWHDRPGRRDTVVDLDGAFVLPGLVNAHDHLELNHYGRLKVRDRYENAAQWIDDMRPRLHEPAIRHQQAHPLRDRLLIGGLKNLFAGATTVAHHNPCYGALQRAFPVRVVTRYGWAHSFTLQDRPVGAGAEPGGDVAERYRATPSAEPFILHLAEGTDLAARDELDRLDELGCLRPNTVLVHGVGLDEEAWRRVVACEASLVWCPASNLFLLGKTVPVTSWCARVPGSDARISLATDSRLTGTRDLLDELRVAHASQRVDAGRLLAMVTTGPARALRLPDAGRIRVGAPADLIVIPRLAETPAAALLAARRADLALVVVNGRPGVGNRDLADIFRARGVAAAAVWLDRIPKILDHVWLRRLTRTAIHEPGLERGEER